MVSLQASTDAELLILLFPHARRAGLLGSLRPKIGWPDDYRVPSQAYFVPSVVTQTYHATAKIVVEIVSSEDGRCGRLPFYFDAGVEEVLLVDPDARDIVWHVRDDALFVPARASEILGIMGVELASRLGWRP